jgi:hypothetical protein
MVAVDAEIEAAAPCSALGGFRRPWLDGRGLPVDEPGRDELSEAAASNDLVVIGQLLGPRDVNGILCTTLGESVVRRPESCVLLDVSVGAGAVEVSKCLLEFHGARPTRETLKMAISSGNLELIRMIWARLPGEQRSRGDLLEVAADFHFEEPLGWLFRDSTVFEQELFFVFALEAHLADGLLAVLCEGVRPWWQRTREAVAKCREAGKIEFGIPPRGFRADSGWWENASGVVREIPALPSKKWTAATSKSTLGTVGEVVSIVLPSGVTAISGDAFADGPKKGWWSGTEFNGYTALRSLMIQSGCLEIEDGAIGFDACWGAMAGCISLVKVTIPATCTSIGNCAFWKCPGLQHLTIPSNVRRIGAHAFEGCCGLMELAIPSGVRSIGQWTLSGCNRLLRLTIPSSVTSVGPESFGGCIRLRDLTFPANCADIGKDMWGRRGPFDGVKTLKCVTLVGHPLAPAVVEAVAPALAPGAKVISPALAGQEFGRFVILAA